MGANDLAVLAGHDIKMKKPWGSDYAVRVFPAQHGLNWIKGASFSGSLQVLS